VIQQSIHNNAFEQHRVAVLIPTYNNAGTLGQVLTDALTYTAHVIVVNDGATDSTGTILEQFPGIQLVSYSPNRGKGIALRRGFAYALEKGYDYVITMDADGQHFASDLPGMLQQIAEKPGALIIGARNLHQENMPGKNTFANKFSNFWFYVNTGLKGPDTQSGYRVYPISLMRNMRFFCSKYEFEVEVIVRSAWKGIQVDWAPVKVYYPPAEERVSHFRPGRDFTRISVLNTVLVLVTFLYIKPRDLIRYLLKKENWKKMWREEVLRSDESNFMKAASIGFGIFMGIVPIWGFQLLVAILVSIRLKLNKALVLLSAHISTPPITPLVIFASFMTGKVWMGQTARDLIFSNGISFDTIRDNLLQYVLGAITLAIGAGIVAWLLSWGLLTIFRKKRTTNSRRNPTIVNL
jgi:glycosyltransferase involved in cell wall biosynthesis